MAKQKQYVEVGSKTYLFDRISKDGSVSAYGPLVWVVKERRWVSTNTARWRAFDIAKVYWPANGRRRRRLST